MPNDMGTAGTAGTTRVVACSHCDERGHEADGEAIVRGDGLRFIAVPVPAGAPGARRRSYICGVCEGSQLRILRPAGDGASPAVAFVDVSPTDVMPASAGEPAYEQAYTWQGTLIAWFRREDAAALGYRRCAVSGRYYDSSGFGLNPARGMYVLLRQVGDNGRSRAQIHPLADVSSRSVQTLGCAAILDIDWQAAGIDRPADLVTVYAPLAETRVVGGNRCSRFWSAAGFHAERCPTCGRESMQVGHEGCAPVDVVERPDGMVCCSRCWAARTAGANYGVRRAVSTTYIARSSATAPSESHRLFPPSMTIGAELETVVSAGANASLFVSRLPRWGWCHDGSITAVRYRRRDAGWGVEFLAPIMQGAAVAEQFGEFAAYWRDDVPESQAAARGWCWVNRTCGYHVHLGAAELSPQQIAQVAAAWIANQSTIYRIQPASRQGRYSAVLSIDGSRLGEIATRSQLAAWWYTGGAGLSARIADSTYREHYHSTRYHGLNLHSYFYRGTIEIRLGAASTDACKLRSWASLMSRFIAAAAESDSVPAAARIKLLATAQRGVAAWARRRARSLNGVSLD